MMYLITYHCTYQVDIRVLDNEENEIMHGIGLRHSSHTMNVSSDGGSEGGEVEFHGSCTGAVTLSKRQKEVRHSSN